MTHQMIHFGPLAFRVSAADAAEIEARRGAGDNDGALALARQLDHGEMLIVSMTMMDGAQPRPEPPSAPKSPPAGKELPVSYSMKKVRVGDADIWTDFRVADELARLRDEKDGLKGELEATKAIAQHGLPGLAPEQAAMTELQHLRAQRDKARNEYIHRTANAWRNPPSA
ncbi:hypothetical protein [Paracraurococcus lichenis]|uniref:Uncharacterized protein n=1 Tax=Paracraurococcus lichenis TaxID=3064888 RepID=A0ABT9E851_9PROT|nr:hypothetical protein [Paracraurococcus sp. LOR1-02]MDO9712386.1 hypothetical protein [Paracraurococcus sp. LOR1-02]